MTRVDGWYRTTQTYLDCCFGCERFTQLLVWCSINVNLRLRRLRQTVSVNKSFITLLTKQNYSPGFEKNRNVNHCPVRDQTQRYQLMNCQKSRCLRPGGCLLSSDSRSNNKPPPLKLQPYGGIEMNVLLLLLLLLINERFTLLLISDCKHVDATHVNNCGGQRISPRSGDPWQNASPRKHKRRSTKVHRILTASVPRNVFSVMIGLMFHLWDDIARSLVMCSYDHAFITFNYTTLLAPWRQIFNIDILFVESRVTMLCVARFMAMWCWCK